jgi:hypothetical protein
MYIRFIKSYVLNNKKRVVGSITGGSESFCRNLIAKKVAEKYTGRMPPPKQDVKFFEPKHTHNTLTHEEKWQQ